MQLPDGYTLLVGEVVELRKSRANSGGLSRLRSWLKADMFAKAQLMLTTDGRMFYSKGVALRDAGVLKSVTRWDG
jgi:hypothetical protein